MTSDRTRGLLGGIVMLAAGCAAEPTGNSASALGDAGNTGDSQGTQGAASDDEGMQGSGGSTEGEATVGDAASGPATSMTTNEPTTAPGDDTGDSSESGSNAAGSIDVTLSGCSIDFSGDIVVSYNGSLGVASLSGGGGTLTGSFQFDLDGPATFTLSSQHRVDTGTVVNMVDPAQGTWTNLDSDALVGGVDTIGGVLDVSEWNPAQGQASIEFVGVSLQNVVDESVCTIDGTVEANELFP